MRLLQHVAALVAVHVKHADIQAEGAEGDFTLQDVAAHFVTVLQDRHAPLNLFQKLIGYRLPVRPTRSVAAPEGPGCGKLKVIVVNAVR